MIVHTSVADFIVFLFVHVSQADNQYDPAELQTIKSRIKDLFPAGTDLEKKLYAAIREYKAFDKKNLNTLVESTIQHFSKFGQLQQHGIVNTLQEIAQADGTIDPSERITLDTLEKLIAAKA